MSREKRIRTVVVCERYDEQSVLYFEDDLSRGLEPGILVGRLHDMLAESLIEESLDEPWSTVTGVFHVAYEEDGATVRKLNEKLQSTATLAYNSYINQVDSAAEAAERAQYEQLKKKFEGETK